MTPTRPTLRLALLLALATTTQAAAAAPNAPPGAPPNAPLVPCPPSPMRVDRSSGTTTEYLGAVPGIPDLCRLRRPDGEGFFYLGLWRSDWPGAGDAYPAARAAIEGGPGTRTHFVTRSVPGLQWDDWFTNDGPDPITIAGRRYDTFKLSHERKGIEGNTYHSVITSWRDPATGATLKTVEHQISGQSYGPGTTWTATRVEP